MDHKCKNNPDRFCFICGNVVLPNCQAKKAYHDYFGVKLRDQGKLFAPHICCKMFGEFGGIVKGRVCFCHSNGLKGRKRSL